MVKILQKQFFLVSMPAISFLLTPPVRMLSSPQDLFQKPQSFQESFLTVLVLYPFVYVFLIYLVIYPNIFVQ